MSFWNKKRLWITVFWLEFTLGKYQTAGIAWYPSLARLNLKLLQVRFRVHVHILAIEFGIESADLSSYLCSGNGNESAGFDVAGSYNSSIAMDRHLLDPAR